MTTIYQPRHRAVLAFWETAAAYAETPWWRIFRRRKLAEQALLIVIHNDLV